MDLQQSFTDLKQNNNIAILMNTMPLGIRTKSHNKKENGNHLQPKVLFKSPAEILKEKTKFLAEEPLEINNVNQKEAMPMETKQDYHPPNTSKEMKIVKKDQKQVHWETSQKSFGNSYSLDPRTEFSPKQKSIQKFTEIPHLLDGFKMVFL